MDIDTINNYIFSKHNIIPGTQQVDIDDVSRNHLGLHSARISTPYTTLCSRIVNFSPEMLRNELYEERNLIKMRCMRTTLHIAPFDIASVLHQATLDMRLAECKLFFTRNNIEKSFVDQFENIIISFVNEPKTAAQIESEIGFYIKVSEDKLKKTFAKTILKYFWELGVLCYVNTAEDWEKENRKYSVTKHFYKGLNLSKCSIHQAQQSLILMYIERFGPVTKKDMAWWSGLSLKIIERVLTENRDKITIIKIDNCDLNFYMTVNEYDQLLKLKKKPAKWVALLAYEDPSLKGYFESRFRYIEDKYYNLLFNQIGEVRASVIYDGRAVGVWFIDKKHKRIIIDLFKKLDADVLKRIYDLKQDYESRLYLNPQISMWDDK